MDEAGEANTSGILIGTRLGVPTGEWNGLECALNNGAAMARFDPVLLMDVGPIAPKGEADRGGSAGASRQGSLGRKLELPYEIGAETTLGVGLNVAALALSNRGDATGEPEEL